MLRWNPRLKRLLTVSVLMSHGQAPPLPSGKFTGKLSRLSVAYIVNARPHCFRLLMQFVRLARSFAFAKAGKSIAARIAIMAMTTSNSISVKPLLLAPRRMFRHPAARKGSTARGLVCFDVFIGRGTWWRPGIKVERPDFPPPMLHWVNTL